MTACWEVGLDWRFAWPHVADQILSSNDENLLIFAGAIRWGWFKGRWSHSFLDRFENRRSLPQEVVMSGLQFPHRGADMHPACCTPPRNMTGCDRLLVHTAPVPLAGIAAQAASERLP